MAHLDLEEQEQIDQLKHFWQRWGNLISWGLIAVLSAYAAWNGWKYWQNHQAAQSAVLFETVERAALSGDTAMLDRSVADIEDKFASTTYAQQAALLAARLYQDKDRVADAKKQLQWVIEHAADDGYQSLARLRLAGLFIQDKTYDEASNVLKAKAPAAFEPLVNDRLGDIAALQGHADEAIGYYQKAWRNLDDRSEYRRVVEVKLAALGQAPDAAASEQDKK
jgi:predicted negative regulator of RcsB-dependent stress response